MKKIQLGEKELKNYRGNAEMVAQIREDHSSELALTELATYTQAALSHIRKQELLLGKSNKPNKREPKRNLKKRSARLLPGSTTGTGRQSAIKTGSHEPSFNRLAAGMCKSRCNRRIIARVKGRL